MRELCVLLVLFISIQADASGERSFATWAPWQPDSLLVAWVLKRHVFPNAQFEALNNGTPIPSDSALDTPDSPYRRSGMRTAFEEALRLNNIDTDCSRRLRPIIRTLELASWRKSEYPEAEAFESGLQPLLPMMPGKGGLEAAFAYVDRFCASSVKTKK
jgi:hypothetical protein